MQRLMMTCLMLALGLAGAAGALADIRRTASRAEEVLRAARAAVGGEEKIRGVHGLTVKGKYRRVIQEREMSGERIFDFLLPDKFMREESFAAPTGTSVTTYRALDGATSWSGGSGGMGGGHMIVMRNGSPIKPAADEQEKMEQMRTRQMRAESARYLLAFMLTPPNNFPLDFTYAGEAEADDGRADVLDATGPEGFSVRLFLDKSTHLPLMLSYRAPKPRVFTMTRSATEKKSPEEALREAQDKAAKDLAQAKPEEVEMQVRFSDYRRAAGGLLLPHRITQGSDGEVSEEWEIKSFEVNPQFKADKFRKK